MCNSNFVTALQQLSLQTVSCYYYFYYVIFQFRTSTIWRSGPFNVMARLALWLTRHQQILFAANLNPLIALLIRAVRQWNRNAENANRLANGLVCGEREDNFKTGNIELTTNSVKDNRSTNQLYRITKTIQAANSHNKKSISFYITTDDQ